jgi:hypothetical protein
MSSSCFNPFPFLFNLCLVGLTTATLVDILPLRTGEKLSTKTISTKQYARWQNPRNLKASWSTRNCSSCGPYGQRYRGKLMRPSGEDFVATYKLTILCRVTSQSCKLTHRKANLSNTHPARTMFYIFFSSSPPAPGFLFPFLFLSPSLPHKIRHRWINHPGLFSGLRYLTSFSFPVNN